jgi:hypothetical protein
MRTARLERARHGMRPACHHSSFTGDASSSAKHSSTEI